MELQPPAQLVVHGGLHHGLAVLPDRHSFNVGTLHSSAEDVPKTDRQTDRQAAARCVKTSEDVLTRGAGCLSTLLWFWPLPAHTLGAIWAWSEVTAVQGRSP